MAWSRTRQRGRAYDPLVRYRLAGLCALVALLCSSVQADARPARHITLKVGDAFAVAGTDLACRFQVGRHVIRGKKLVTCFKIARGELAARSYIVALAVNGRVVVARIKADGSISEPVFDRTPAAFDAGARQIVVHAGDEILLSGTHLGCGINDDASGVYPACLLASSTGGRPGSYGFAETERFTAVVRFGPTGKTSKLVFRRFHGR